MTGAPLPTGADAVVMVEHTSLLADQPAGKPGGKLRGKLEVRRSLSVGENFVPRGAEGRAGQLLLDRGRRLDHAGMAIAAMGGKSRVVGFRKRGVAGLSALESCVGVCS